MFSSNSIFYQKKIRFPNQEKMKKIMKESIDRSIHKFTEKYKNINTKIETKIETKINKYENHNSRHMITILPFIVFGWGFYHLSKSVFTKH
jgi:hypothetical protein